MTPDSSSHIWKPASVELSTIVVLNTCIDMHRLANIYICDNTYNLFMNAGVIGSL